MEGLLHYINPAHAISLLSALNEERLKGQLCDVLLIVGDQKFRAHKNVLAASSEYFQSLFTNKENESQTVFQLDFCEPDTFDNVLNYIYSSSLFVEKSSLAAVQELGYSLGISFLTNIVSRTPQAPFPACPNRKKVFIEDDENSSQKRSVIVCQSRNEGKTVSQNQPDVSHTLRPSPSIAVKTNTSKPHVPKPIEPLHGLSAAEKSWPKDSTGGYVKSLEHAGTLDDPNRSSMGKRNTVLPSKPLQERDTVDDKPGVSSQLPKGKAIELALKRPRPPVLSLRSSSETPYLFKETNKGSGSGEDRNLLYYSKLGLVVPSSVSGSGNQSIDRSGPLVKSLLRRSLSMDSQVPVYSPSIDLKSSQGSSSGSSDTPGNVFCALSQKSSLKDCKEKTALDDRPQVLQPHRLRSFSASQSTDRESASPVTEVHIKTEPSSPLSDPSDIIRVTVGDAAATASSSTTRDLSLKTEDQKDMSRLPAKRRFQADRRLPFKKLKVNEHGSPVSEDHFEEHSNPTLLDTDFPDTDLNKDEFGELEGTRPNKKFKCKHCLKIFRSTAGLHRHVNMYHNPEKPYACDICHKRFHTNFKVWTHCQTQHGIVKNPSPAASSHAVLDEKFQRKLIDIVREREIKKALIIKLRRGKPGFQGQSSSQTQQAIKRNLRSRAKGAYICAYCGKAYRFLSQFKQHIKMHPGEKPLGVNRVAKPKEHAPLASPVETKEVYQCRLCNAKLSSLLEQGSHERLCRNATVCPYCSLRFFSPELKREHEHECEYKKLTCLECMRTFKSSFSIWRHQVEVHNQNSMAPAENFSLPTLDHNGEVTSSSRPQPQPEPNKVNHVVTTKEDNVFSDSSEQVNFDSEDSSCLPEDLSLSKQLKIQVKEEPVEEAEEEAPEASVAPKEAGPSKDTSLWPCEKCGKMFTVHKQLERHQELLCSVKPFICHVCNKAFRTNFRLWSHFQSHMSQATEGSAHTDSEVCPVPTNSPSPPPLPPPPPLPKIQPLEPDSPTGLSENSTSATEKLFVPQESDTLFYHAPPLSAITFKRQFMCKLCHRTFKTAFSLWSHEQTHN
ncbi:zinc finger and BTB domain-containing protein 21 isoform X1 [Tupaia chinensis]|uniref:Zinc finger protein 295 n=1 Tax=Tupaia chinensis TaxID=246437 RepID=L9JVI0_TUPCH|nr:zinc finger and BTB domain-containing protein 21 isoform X1 [Tupaia chinensis]XP_006156432.1 zinc finger and BTB domain-containing protein 21 isoform X1 [Tupaia chinensis]XP_006156433.1 zinc finger and BTB domain-containing protein 21 isoform X1 [Tupaia chinensis]ELW53207.1 Zinc finger protein 295 [Tupaia chinensis]